MKHIVVTLIATLLVGCVSTANCHLLVEAASTGDPAPDEQNLAGR